jgi:hypothetical protein
METKFFIQSLSTQNLIVWLWCVVELVVWPCAAGLSRGDGIGSLCIIDQHRSCASSGSSTMPACMPMLFDKTRQRWMKS